MTPLPTAKGPPRHVLWIWLAALAGLFAAGCADARQTLGQVRADLRQAREDNDRLQAELQDARQAIADQGRQIATLQGLGEKRRELLFLVAGVRLGRYTGGADFDGKPGDDGIRVYLCPVDRDGHALKAAGEVSIQLFDLAAENDKNLLARYDLSVAEVAKHWAAGFMTYHYRFDCAWKTRPPGQPEVTVRVAFTDYFTGKTFNAQKVCQVSLAPESK